MWSSSTSSTSKKKRKTNRQSSSNDLRRFDMGVNDLTWWKDDDNGAEAGSSDISQKRRRSQSPQQANTAPTKALHKRQKTCGSRRRNHFLDLYAAHDEEDEEETDTGALAAGPSQASEVLPAGRIAFASRVDEICRHYEGSHTTGASPHTTPGSPFSHSHTLLASNPEANSRVYKLDVMTSMILTLRRFLSNLSHRRSSQIHSASTTVEVIQGHFGLSSDSVRRSCKSEGNQNIPPPKPLLRRVTNHSCSDRRDRTTIFASRSFCFWILGSREAGHIPK